MFDPRTKLILAIFYATVVVVSDRPAALTAEWGALVLLIVLMEQAKAYFRWLRLVLPMSLFFAAVTWWSANAAAGAAAGLKLLALTSGFFAFFSTTVPEDLGNALVKTGMPYHIAFVLSTSMQFVPVLGRKAKNVLESQRARGIPIEPGWSALRHYPAFLVPLLIQAFQLAEELAEAMETRGFGLPNRTFYKDYRLGVQDWLALGIGLVILIGLLVWQRL
jgi:energy-coupling factor transport system permease protein